MASSSFALRLTARGRSERLSTGFRARLRQYHSADGAFFTQLPDVDDDHRLRRKGSSFPSFFDQYRRRCQITYGEQKESEAGFAIKGYEGVAPFARRLGSEDPQRRSRDEMALKVEGVVDGGMHAQKRWADRADLNRSSCALVAAPPDAISRPDCSARAPVHGGRSAAGAGTPRRRSAACRSPATSVRTLLLEKLAHQPHAARLSRRRCTSMSRTSPSWSTARRRYIRSPAIRTTISSRCHRLLGRGRRRRSRRAITGPNSSTQLRTVS